MSESGDSFAKSGLMLSRWATSTSDLESVDLTRSNQHSSATDQAMMLKQLKFELAWKTREEIVNSLNEHTKLLSGLVLKADIREKMRRENIELVTVLMNLPVKVECRSRSSESFESDSDESLTELVLDLSSEVRSRIVDALTINQSISLMDSHSIESQLKSKLIERNNELIGELYRLRARAIPRNSSLANGDALIGLAKESESQTSNDNALREKKLDEPNKSDLAAEEVAILKKELEKLKVQDSLISNLREKLAESNDELAKLKVQVEGMEDVNEVTIILEFKGIETLLAAGPGEKKESKCFACGGFHWYVKITNSVVDGVEHLGAFIHRKSITKDDWSVVASYELRLLNCFESNPVATFFDTLSGLPIFTDDVVRFSNAITFNGCGWGLTSFITVKELRANSFIRDDTIKFQVKVSVKSSEKIAN